MKSVVVYESMYGNTREVADAIAEGLGSVCDVTVLPVTGIEAGAVAHADLLVVGGPTHVHGMSRTSSRRAAVEAAGHDDTIHLDPDAEGPGLREWFQQLPDASATPAASFDTRIDKPALLTGSAARGIAKQLRKHGYEHMSGPVSFFVDDSDGPLQDGELERARDWGQLLAERCRNLATT